MPVRLDVQFDADGSQSHELSRSKSGDYSRADLEEWIRLVRLAENVDFDLFNFETNSGKSVKKAYNWLKIYGTAEKKEEYQQITYTNIPKSFEQIENQIRSLRYNKNTDIIGSTIRTIEKIVAVNDSNFKNLLIH